MSASQVELAPFVRLAAQADVSYATLHTHTGYPLSGVCAALTNTSRAERLLTWIENSYIVQDHAASVAEEILQVLSPEPDGRPSAHPAFRIVYNAVHMLIWNDEIPQYIANPDILHSSHAYLSSFCDWARSAIGRKHMASMTRLVHRIAVITIHYLSHFAEAHPGDPQSVFGLLSQQPTSRHHLVA